MSNKKFLSAAFADDLYTFTNSFCGLLRIVHHIERFSLASGLVMNYEKTKGLFFNKTSSIDFRQLPLDLSNWNQNIEILGVPYGSTEWKLSFWKNICRTIQDDLRLYSQVGATFDAKAI